MRTSQRFLVTIFLVTCAALLASSCYDPAKVIAPPACTDCYASADELIAGLSTAYRQRDYDRFTGLFPATADSAPYLFILNEPVNGVANWGLTEELRIHRRMFVPEDPLPGEIPVPDELWLNSITITLARTATAWLERTDLYMSAANPAGLDPVRWRATEAEHHADVFFETAGDTDYRVDGRVNFVVIEDLAKQAGYMHRLLIYRWEDLGNFLDLAIAVQPTTWSQVKDLYR
jgi:hypothetical protein